LPPCRIIAGTDDPLHDDAWRFLMRLIKNNVKCKLHLFPDMPHGFVSMGRMENYQLVVSNTIGIMRDLMSENNSFSSSK